MRFNINYSDNEIKQNTSTNVTVIIHLYHTQLANKILNYVNDVKKIFTLVNVIISVSKDIKEDKFIEIKNMFKNAIFIKVPNKGVDVYPFLLSIKYLRSNNIKTDFILKLHSKISSRDNSGSDWFEELVVPITNYNNLSIIQDYFKMYDDIGFVSAQKYVLPKKYDLDFPQNIKGVNQVINLFPHLERDWKEFNGGNMFWISNKVLDQYLTDELIDYIIPKFVEGKPPNNLLDKGIYIEYVCERLFTGVFCYNKKNLYMN